MGTIEEFARSVAEYIMRRYVEVWGRDLVRYFRAQVVTPADGKTMQVRRPFDETVLTLPYSSAASELKAGDQCIVLVLGELSNAIVFSDGRMRSIGGSSAIT